MHQMYAVTQAYQFCMVPEKGDTSSSSCFLCFLHRLISEEFTVFLKVLFMDRNDKGYINEHSWALPKTF